MCLANEDYFRQCLFLRLQLIQQEADFKEICALALPLQSIIFDFFIIDSFK